MKGSKTRTVDILVAIDCDQIIEDYGGQDDAHKPSTEPLKPTQLSDPKKYIYMITKSSDVISGNAGDALNIKVKVGDVIRWRETSLTADFDSSTVFANFVGYTSANDGRISDPRPEVDDKMEPQPVEGAPPWKIAMKSTPYHYWQCEVKHKKEGPDPGKVTYHWIFQIFDPDGKSLGYFAWDPWITIV